jgi:hypothetical protein
MTKDTYFLRELNKIQQRSSELERTFKQIERDTVDRIDKAMTTIRQFQSSAEEVKLIYPRLIEEKNKEIEELKLRIEELEAGAVEIVTEDPLLVKASTIAIFDSIIFAIENWSTTGDTAPDFSLACQAILFPMVYDQVMSGNSHYYLKRVPDAALEVVKRGREYVAFIRSVCDVGLTEPTAWANHLPMISKWWINDALPLLYGARDPAWEENSILSLEAIMTWRDQPASRALDFPLVFDAMDLVDRYGESIRETTRLPEFTLDTLNTRLEANQ